MSWAYPKRSSRRRRGTGVRCSSQGRCPSRGSHTSVASPPLRRTRPNWSTPARWTQGTSAVCNVMQRACNMTLSVQVCFLDWRFKITPLFGQDPLAAICFGFLSEARGETTNLKWEFQIQKQNGEGRRHFYSESIAFFTLDPLIIGGPEKMFLKTFRPIYASER